MKTQSAIRITFLVVFLLATFSSIGTAAVTAAPNHGWIDLRNASFQDRHTLVIAARDSGSIVQLPGHAYMVLGRERAAELACYDELFGLHPKNTVSGAVSWAIGPVRGKVTAAEKDRDGSLIQQRIFLEINPDQHDAVKAFIRKKSAAPTYELGESDCVGFMVSVLQELNRHIPDSGARLAVPDRALDTATPERYVERFIAENHARIVSSRPR